MVANLDDAREWKAQADQILADEEASFLPGDGKRQTRRKESFEVAAEALAALDKARFKVSEAESALEIGWASDDLHQQVADFRADIDAAIAQLRKEEKLFRDLDAARMQRMTRVQRSLLSEGGGNPQTEAYDGGDFDFAGSTQQYQAALTRFGLRGPPFDFAVLTDLIGRQRSTVRHSIVAALDDWSFAAENTESEIFPSWRDLSDLAQRMDEDPWLKRVRHARRTQDSAQLAAVAKEGLNSRQSPSALEQLARHLQFVGRSREAISLLRQARIQYPEDVWIHFTLSELLYRKEARTALELEEAVGCSNSAIALRPDSAAAYNNLAVALADKNDLDGAIAGYKLALNIDPRLVEAHYSLGVALYTAGDLDGATAAFRAALQINPLFAAAHFNLGLTLATKKDFDGAIAAYERALECNSRLAFAHNNIGVALCAKGDLDGGVDAYNDALKISPRFAEAHGNLGLALHNKGNLQGAIAAYKRALEINPRAVRAQCNLGISLEFAGDLPGAIAAYEKALEIDPRFVDAHLNLGLAQVHSGEFSAAVASIRRGLDELPNTDPRRQLVTSQLQTASAWAALELELAEVLSGKKLTTHNQQRVAFTQVCLAQRRFATAVRFYSEAFAEDPQLCFDLTAAHRYYAACCAALAGCGHGNDAADLNEAVRAGMRKQALEWLSADFQLWKDILTNGEPNVRDAILQTVPQWQQDPDLAGIRDAAELDKLPKEERAACRQLWADVAELLDRAAAEHEPIEAR